MQILDSEKTKEAKIYDTDFLPWGNSRVVVSPVWVKEFEGESGSSMRVKLKIKEILEDESGTMAVGACYLHAFQIYHATQWVAQKEAKSMRSFVFALDGKLDDNSNIQKNVEKLIGLGPDLEAKNMTCVLQSKDTVRKDGKGNFTQRFFHPAK